MSLECSECEYDARQGHAPTCSRNDAPTNQESEQPALEQRLYDEGRCPNCGLPEQECREGGNTLPSEQPVAPVTASHEHEWERGLHMAQAFGVDGRQYACAICGVTKSPITRETKHRSNWRPAHVRLLNARVITEAGCWENPKGIHDRRGYLRTHEGYGATRVQRGAHRIMYEALVGPIPEGLTIDHLCRNTGCFNPAHLEPVTQRENNYRGNLISNVHRLKTECLRGHPFDEANTLRDKRGGRRCRICANANARRRKAVA